MARVNIIFRPISGASFYFSDVSRLKIIRNEEYEGKTNMLEDFISHQIKTVTVKYDSAMKLMTHLWNVIHRRPHLL